MKKDKAFYRNFNLKSEGAYSNGDRNEKGKEFYEDGNLKNIKIFNFFIFNKE